MNLILKISQKSVIQWLIRYKLIQLYFKNSLNQHQEIIIYPMKVYMVALQEIGRIFSDKSVLWANIHILGSKVFKVRLCISKANCYYSVHFYIFIYLHCSFFNMACWFGLLGVYNKLPSITITIITSVFEEMLVYFRVVHPWQAKFKE